MNKKLLCLLSLMLFCLSSRAQQPPPVPPADPTSLSPKMRAALMTTGSSIPAFTVKGVVIGAGRKGVVLLEAPGPVNVMARAQIPFNVTVQGISMQLNVKSITINGIELENSAAKETVILPVAGGIQERPIVRPGIDIAYLELRDAPLMDALRMIAEQSDNNYSASATANKTPVSAYLRLVSSDNAVEEICKSHSLWFKKDQASGITRIMDVKEFEKDLVGFREEQTEVFTMLYPNATDVAIAIADVFGDRVELSLGNTDINQDARDLQSRFTRFNILGQGNRIASTYQNSSTTYGSGGGYGGAGTGYGGYGGGYGMGMGGYGMGGMGMGGMGMGMTGYGMGTSGYNPQTNRNNNGNEDRQTPMEDTTDRFANLTPDQAARVQQALEAPPGDPRRDNADLNALRTKTPSIYVSANRRSNTVVVRTADPKIMDDIRTLIRRLDVPTPLVLLEVKVLNVTLGTGFQSAFDYAFNGGKFGGTFSSGTISHGVSYDPSTGAATGLTTTPGVGSTGLNSGSLVFQYLSDKVNVRLQLLETENRINTIASPTLLTSHNEVARLFLGEERPLVRNISSQTILNNNNVATTPNTQLEFRSVGTTLLITPNINSDRTVTLRLLQENSSINQGGATVPVVTSNTNAAAGGNANTGVTSVAIDTVSSRSVSGTFAAADGRAVVVGGLISDANNNTVQRIPWLGRIPGLGILFRRQNKNDTKSEMLVIIRPHILSTPADGEKISNQLMNDLSATSRQRLEEAGYLPPVAPPYEKGPVPPVIERGKPGIGFPAKK